MVDAAANEAALRYLAEELRRAQLQAAIATGNLAHAERLLAQRDAELSELHAGASSRRRAR